MMIKIAQRFHPFSHRNGARFLLPGSSFSIQIFPTRLIFVDLEGKGDSFFLSFDFVGPLSDFTAELDLEHGAVHVFGVTKKGYMRYLICAKREGIWLTMEKIPEGKNLICRRSFSPEQLSFEQGKGLLISPLFYNCPLTKNEERLSLGSHKAQEWEFICRRLDFREIFPIWLSLSYWTPLRREESDQGNYRLLEECRQRMERGEKQKITEAFKSLFLAAFEGIFVPRLCDTEYQGILPEGELQRPFPSPLALLTEGANLIRSLFIHEKNNSIAILPCLPPEFPSGRMTHVKAGEGAILDFEWTKKSLRQLQISSSCATHLLLKLPKGIRRCRIKKGRQGIKNLSLDEGSAILALSSHEKVEMDRFET